MGLLELSQELPAASKVDMSAIGAESAEENHEKADAPASPAEKAAEKPQAVAPPPAAAPEDKEPGPRATKAEIDEYRKRKVKQYEEQAAKEKAQREAAEQRLKDLEERQKEWEKLAKERREHAPAAPKTPEPAKQPEYDVEKDPKNYVLNKFKTLEERQKQLDEHYQQIQIERASAAADEYLSGKASNIPDFSQAMAHIEKAEFAKAKIQFPQYSDAQLKQAFKMFKLQLAAKLENSGKDPAQGLYELAQSAYFYQKPAPAAAAPAAPDPAAKFEAIKKNKARTATGLTAGGEGGSGAGYAHASTDKKSIRDILGMSKAEKEAYFAERRA